MATSPPQKETVTSAGRGVCDIVCDNGLPCSSCPLCHQNHSLNTEDQHPLLDARETGMSNVVTLPIAHQYTSGGKLQGQHSLRLRNILASSGLKLLRSVKSVPQRLQCPYIETLSPCWYTTSLSPEAGHPPTDTHKPPPTSKHPDLDLPARASHRRHSIWPGTGHWNGNEIILMRFWSLDADQKFDNFRCIQLRKKNHQNNDHFRYLGEGPANMAIITGGEHRIPKRAWDGSICITCAILTESLMFLWWSTQWNYCRKIWCGCVIIPYV